jgi:hypothetical protein
MLSHRRPVSFHAVSFGPSNEVLKQMVELANQSENSVERDPDHPIVPSKYHEALTSVELAQAFIGIAESLRKTRASLMSI